MTSASKPKILESEPLTSMRSLNFIVLILVEISSNLHPLRDCKTFGELLSIVMTSSKVIVDFKASKIPEGSLILVFLAPYKVSLALEPAIDPGATLPLYSCAFPNSIYPGI